jgi:Zn ribbon nucleic-acid-binding protein
MSKQCPACASIDTVSYWDIKANQGNSISILVTKQYYPDARKCVDCEHVWWHERREHPVLSGLTKAKP